MFAIGILVMLSLLLDLSPCYVCCRDIGKAIPSLMFAIWILASIFLFLTFVIRILPNISLSLLFIIEILPSLLL